MLLNVAVSTINIDDVAATFVKENVKYVQYVKPITNLSPPAVESGGGGGRGGSPPPCLPGGAVEGPLFRFLRLLRLLPLHQL